MAWKCFRLGGSSYDLDHLNTRLFEVTPNVTGAMTRKVKISFGCHTFTRELLAGDRPDVHFRHAGEVRAFCTVRHAHSLNLPKIVDYAASGEGHISARRKTSFCWIQELGYRIRYSLICVARGLLIATWLCLWSRPILSPTFRQGCTRLRFQRWSQQLLPGST